MYAKRGLAKIDEERQDLLDQLTGILNDVLDSLCRDQKLCGFECDSMLLGAIIRQLYSHCLIWPKPSEPFIGVSFVESARAVRSLRTPTWCDMTMRTTATRSSGGGDSLFSERTKKNRKKRSVWDEDLEQIVEVRECPQHACTLRDLLGRKVDRLEDNVVGLDLERI